jgi:hypothetical protein
MDHQQQALVCARRAWLALLCALLMLFASFAQANHVHTNKPASANRECSVCSVAHAGTLISATYQAIPVLARSILTVCPEASPHSLLVTPFRCSRPPPSA